MQEEKFEAANGSALVDGYLSNLVDDERACLEILRLQIHEAVRNAEECLSYNIPAFRLEGSIVGGFAAFKKHLSYLPFSGSVLATLSEELGTRSRTKSALHFTPRDPLPREIVHRLLEVRLDEIRIRGR